MDFRRILSDAGFTAVSRFVSIAQGFIFVPLVTKLLGVDSYGIWITATAVIHTAAHLGGMYIYSSLIRYFPSDGEQVFSDTIVLTLLGSCVTVTLILLGGTLSSHLPVDITPLRMVLVPIAVCAGGQVLLNFLNNYFRARQKVKHFEVVTTVEQAVETIVVLGVLLQSREIVAGLWGLAGTTLTFDLLLLGIFLWNRPPIPNPQNFGKYIRYSLPLIPKGFGGKMLSHADKFIIIIFLGSTSVGVYAVAYSVSRLLTRISGIFNSTLLPNVSSAWDEEEFNQITTLYEGFLRWYTILSIPAVTGISLLASEILSVISTNEVVSSGTVLVSVLLIGFAFQAVEIPLGHVLSAAEETKLLSYITLGTMVINVIANITLIPIFGLAGAAVATTVAFFIRTVWTYRKVTEYVDITLTIVPALKSIIASICMLLVLIIFPITQEELRLVVYPLFGAVTFGYIFVSIGGLQPSDWDAINQLI